MKNWLAVVVVALFAVAGVWAGYNWYKKSPYTGALVGAFIGAIVGDVVTHAAM